MTKNKIVGLGAELRKYRTEIPNIVDEMDMDPFEFRLYHHIKRVAGENGTCWKSTRSLAKSTNMSVGKVSSSKKTLQERGLIRILDDPHPTGTDEIEIVDLWERNFRYFFTRSSGERDVRDVNDRVHDMKQRNNNLRNPEEGGDADLDQDFGKVMREYESNIGIITPYIADDLKWAVDEYPVEWILESMKVAVKYNARNWKYCEAILERWKRDGRGQDIRDGDDSGSVSIPEMTREEFENLPSVE